MSVEAIVEVGIHTLLIFITAPGRGRVTRIFLTGLGDDVVPPNDEEREFWTGHNVFVGNEMLQNFAVIHPCTFAQLSLMIGHVKQVATNAKIVVVIHEVCQK